MILLALFWSAALQADAIPILDQPVHLRSGAEREWDDFPEQAAGPALRLTFAAQPNASEYALSLRQRDVKSATWTVRLNGRALGALAADERDMRALLVVPPGALHAGANTLEIATASGRVPDDIEIREARLYPQPVRELLREATVSVDAGELPVKITVVDSSGALMPLAPLGDPAREAVRTGVVYTASGRTRFGLPAGDYRIFASRGWEYDAPSQPVRLRAGQSGRVQLRLHREVTLPGYVSIDTHVHTLELSGHGDAAVRERILTAAAEALDIVVATEHNRTSDYSQAARELGLERLLLPVRGMEVTTATGHFNVFPLPREAPAPEVRERDWLKLARSIQDMPGGRVIIQNHPRDLHSNYRPFDPSHHLSSAGENLNGRPVFANAMEVVNSGAMQSDILQPVRDWLGLLNRGYRVAAIGASDTHTVDFVPIGQARTYIDIRGLGPEWRSRQKELFERLARGENLVAYGLAANLRVVHQSRRKLDLEAAVYGPSWSASDRLTIYANGSPAAEQRLPPGSAAGRKWSGRIELDVPHDTIVVAVASGPGVRRPFWEVRKPYQPTGTSWNPRVIGISKAIRVDVDGHGFQSARDYAVRLVEKHGAPTSRLTDDLKAYDDSVVIQVLTLLASSGHKPETLRELFDGQKAYGRFLEEWNRTVPPKSPASGR